MTVFPDTGVDAAAIGANPAFRKYRSDAPVSAERRVDLAAFRDAAIPARTQVDHPARIVDTTGGLLLVPSDDVVDRLLALRLEHQETLSSLDSRNLP